MNRAQALAKCRLAIKRVERRVDRTVAQRRHFDQMSAPLEVWADKWSTTTLERWLHLDHLPIEEREKALVALALQATDAAGAVIDAYDPRGAGEDHELFHQIARTEWEQRHQSKARRSAA